MERMRRARLMKSLESLERLQNEMVDEAKQELAHAHSLMDQTLSQINTLEMEYKHQKSELSAMNLEEKITFVGYADQYFLKKARLHEKLEEERQEIERIIEGLKEKYRDQRIIQKNLDKHHDEKRYDDYLDERKGFDEISLYLYGQKSLR